MGLGSMLKKLFGGEPGAAAEPDVTQAIEYKGYQIFLKARRLDGQFGVGGLIRKEIDGEMREHLFIRADQAPSREQCDEITLQKAKNAIDHLGDSLFSG